MFLLGLIAAVCFVPGYTGAYIPTQWVLGSCLLPLALWRRGPWTHLHWVGVGFLSYAALSMAWAADYYDGIWGLWLLSMIALSFWLGTTLPSMDSLLKGLALGLAVSSAVAVAQLWGWAHWSWKPSGLLFNSVILGETCALVIVGLVSRGLWLWIPGILPAFVLSQSRGAILLLAMGLVFIYMRRPLVLLCIALGLTWTITYFPADSDILRLIIWNTTIHHLSLFGWGSGSFLGLFIGVEHPEYAHNDFLQLWFEYGVGSLALAYILAVCLLRTNQHEWPILATFCVAALFSYPFYTPLLALLGACAAGRCARDWDLSRRIRERCRLDNLPLARARPSRTLPLQSRTSNNLPLLEQVR